MSSKLLFMVSAILFLAGSSSAHADQLRTQAPCVASKDPCVFFDAGSLNKDVIIRAFTFNVPAPTDALVSFHGSLDCVEPGGMTMTLFSQIVGNAATSPAPTGPSGLQHAAMLGKLSTPVGTVSFNLASERVVRFPTAGRKTLFFKVRPVVFNSTAACSANVAAFTVQLPS